MIEFTDRQKEIAHRFFHRQLDGDRLKEVLVSLEPQVEYVKTIRLGDLYFKYKMWVMTDDFTDFDPEVEGKQFGNYLTVEYKGKLVLKYISSNEFINYERWVKFYKEFPNAVMCLSCEGYFEAIKHTDEFCDNCDPFVFENVDVCSICLSDDRNVWVKTKCGHIFHSPCWEKVKIEDSKKRKCPLCRTLVAYEDYTIL
jgi:hypothetical protein